LVLRKRIAPEQARIFGKHTYMYNAPWWTLFTNLIIVVLWALTERLDAMFNAAQAYPGWGFLDWLANRYVYLSCNDVYETKPCGAGAIAYYFPTDAYKYPLVIFCPAFFTSIQSLDDAIQKIDDNLNLQQNSLNLESRAMVLFTSFSISVGVRHRNAAGLRREKVAQTTGSCWAVNRQCPTHQEQPNS
jgi:hypothetical protein